MVGNTGSLFKALAALGAQTPHQSASGSSLEEEIERLQKNMNNFDLKKLTAIEAMELMVIFADAVKLVHNLNVFFDRVKKSHAINTEGISYEDQES